MMVVEKTFPWFDLPGEIRNDIMERVLVTGELHPFDTQRYSKASNFVPPNIGLLRTCRRANMEGSSIWYSQNLFILPPGQVENTHKWLNTIQP